MPSTRTIPTSIEDVRAASTKSLYAAVGAGDLAVETARKARADASDKLSARVRAAQDVVGSDPRDVAADIRTRIEALAADLRTEAAKVPGMFEDLPGQVAGLLAGSRERLETTYDDLTERGESLVGRIRRQQATEDLAEQAESTVRATKAAGTRAKNAAGSARSGVKGAATSATKTAKKAAKATEAAADETGRSTARTRPAKRTAKTAKTTAKKATKKTSKRTTKKAAAKK